MTKILVVEDDRSLREGLAFNLQRDGYTVALASTAQEAVSMAQSERPELVILDLMLPGGSGFDVCRSIRAFSKVPIIILTAKGDPMDKIVGLEIGADDYVTKPFSLRELLARVKAALRRVALEQQPVEESTLRCGSLELSLHERVVEVGGMTIDLQPKEFDLLAYFMRHQGTVLTRDRLLSHVWGHEYVGERTVDVHIRRLRSKLEQHALDSLIGTVHGVGYVFNRRVGPTTTPAAQSSPVG